MDTPQTLTPGCELLDATGAVCRDTPCRRCAYNLRGLKAEGQCPECGTPVRNSISGDLLRFADPQWVEKLARGIRFILWGIAVSIVVAVLGFIAAARLGPLAGETLGLVGGALGLYGAWLLTEPDPSGIGEDRYGRSRKFIRIALLLGVFDSVLMVPLSAVVFPSMVAIGLAVTSVVAGIISAFGEIAKLTYLQRLAERIPEPEYEEKARSLRWQYGGCMLITALFGGLVLVPGIVGMTGPVAGAVLAMSCVFSLVALCMVVFGLRYLSLLYRMGKTLTVHAELARAAWVPAAPTATPAET